MVKMSPYVEKHEIDWATLWKSLDWEDESHRREAAHQRLHKRALQYAKPVEDADIVGDTHTLLVFHLGTETYAVDVMVVRGIRLLAEMTKITRVPGAPRFYRGVVNIRGQITSVLDLRLFFEMTVDEQSRPRELVIVQANKLEIGLLADHVEGVMTIPHEAIEPLEDTHYALGITMERQIVLDVEQMFTDDRLIIGGVDE